MNNLFAFDPSEIVLKVNLAWTYTPRILTNHIHARPCSSFLYILRGTYTYSYSNESFTADADSLIYLPAGSIPYNYMINSEDGIEPQSLQIVFDLLDSQSRSPIYFSSHPIIVPLAKTDAVKYSLKATISAFSKKDAASQLIAISELLRVFAICIQNRQNKTDTNVSKTIAPAVEYLVKNYNKNITAKELAELCHISESQLRRCFQTAIGKSPMAYKRQLMCDAACNLLRIGEFRVSEIAELMGYSDIYSFSHFFTKEKGISPLEYRLFTEENGST